MEHDILVDGYNVIKNNLMFQAMGTKNMAEARQLLIRQLKNRYHHSVQRVTVVFDGNGKKEQISHEDHIRIIFSRAGETADSVIARLAKEARLAGRTVMMYSNDQEVRAAVIEHGGGIKTTGDLTRHLNTAPADMVQRSLHRQEMRRIYGIDPSRKWVDEVEEAPYLYGKKKKKKSRYHK
ncbi:MAG TPA: NYN domain-containing protein [Ktedonobacteraceae bacterium]|jgi:predicted RNA-binding protein with PIN domain|nr:NYN domain-containing protein [Ktedonobacteraceae bacterium]